jgi:hypothetical protein
VHRLGCRGRTAYHVVRASQESYYDVLGVPRNADLKQIKQAFKRKALKLHPDVNKAVSVLHPMPRKLRVTYPAGNEFTNHECHLKSGVLLPLQPDAKEKFMECKRAYQALSDTQQRSRYDREQVLLAHSLPQSCLWCSTTRGDSMISSYCMTCLRGVHMREQSRCFCVC